MLVCKWVGVYGDPPDPNVHLGSEGLVLDWHLLQIIERIEPINNSTDTAYESTKHM